MHDLCMDIIENYLDIILDNFRNEEQRTELKRILEMVEEEENRANGEEKKEKFWSVQPMQKAIQENKFSMLCLLNIIGGHWNTVGDDDGKDMINLLTDQMSNDGNALNEWNYCLKLWISSAADRNGKTMLHQSARYQKS